MSADELHELKRRLLQLLPDEGISAVIALLKKSLPENAAKFSALFQIETRLNMTNRDKIRGVLSQEQLELAYNRLSADLLDLVNSLEEADFSGTGAPGKSGSILYKIPQTMQVNQEKRCFVRLAFEEDVIIQNVDLIGTTMKPIRVAEVMEVSLLDPNETPAFTIRELNSPEQFIEKGDFTEWVFFVKPLRTGELPLALRVSVLEMVAGKDRKKEIVLEELIHVVAEPDNDGYEETTTFKNAGYTITYSDAPEAAAEPDSPGPGDRQNKRRLLLALLVVFMMGAGAWALGVPQEAGWWWVNFKNNKTGYEWYLDHWPKGPHSKEAREKLDSIGWEAALQSGTDSAFNAYLSEFPDGRNRSDAQHKLDSLRNLTLPLPERDTSRVPIPAPDSIAPATGSIRPPEPDAVTTVKPSRPVKKPTSPKPKPTPTGQQPATGPISVPAPTSTTPTRDTASPPVKTETPPVVPGRHSGFEMVPVTGGAFTMGDKNGDKDECPHPVTIQSFKIGKYEVTQADWKSVMGSNPAFFKDCDECPVENISWNDAQEFIQKASALRGTRYRMPTEAEWEYAARGGAGAEQQKYAGSNHAGSVAWNHGNTERTNRVGRKQANALGVYDMSGNVWEWCLDQYQPYPGCSGKSNNERVLRGGSWRNYDQFCRVGNRNSEKPGKRDYVNGLRLAQDR